MADLFRMDQIGPRGAFFPIFGDGNTPAAIIVSSIILWTVHFMILRGIQGAAFINKVVTVAKIVPIFVFIVIMAFAFKYNLFAANSGAAATAQPTSSTRCAALRRRD